MIYLGIASRGVLGGSTSEEVAALAVSWGVISAFTEPPNFLEVVSLSSSFSRGFTGVSAPTTSLAGVSLFSRDFLESSTVTRVKYLNSTLGLEVV